MAKNPDPTLLPTRSLAPGQRTEVWVFDLDTGEPELVHTDPAVLLEAPNWAPQDEALLLNGDGLPWHLDLHIGVPPSVVRTHDLPPINNDHVIDGPRGLIYLSGNDGHLYVAPLGGGYARRVSDADDRYHFLHGVSPDGLTLAFVDIPRDAVTAAGRLALMPAAGGPIRHLDAGTGHLDGPEFSPDGSWIYLNTEHFGSAPGHAQIARLPADGGPLERLVASETVDWFPHVAPDGAHAAYLSFPAGTLGHPPDLDVVLHVVSTSDWATDLHTIPLFGGQGTINVSSWSPDGRRFAYVAYPVAAAGE